VATRAMLRTMIEEAVRCGIQLQGLDGPCGPPLCLSGADPRVMQLHALPGRADERSYVPKCEGCAVRFACHGVRDRQLGLFGNEWVEPFAALP
ncbi:MAG: hypothetical protein WCJ30_05235, partial [Deltaproteobacteria bacterium]